MNTISCSNCGIVIDVNRFSDNILELIETPDGGIDTSRSIWDGDEFVPAFNALYARRK